MVPRWMFGVLAAFWAKCVHAYCLYIYMCVCVCVCFQDDIRHRFLQ